jgi:hypothetical protein
VPYRFINCSPDRLRNFFIQLMASSRESMDLNLKDKAVFITGSTAGVGLQSHDPLQEKALASISKGARKAG